MATTPTPTATTTTDVPLATDAPKAQTTAKIGKVIMTILIIAIILLVIVFLAIRARTTNVIAGGKTTIEPREELIPISTTEWVRVPTDPSRETCEFSIIDQSLKYFLVINKDFKHPQELPGKGVVEFKGVTRTHDFCLKSGQGVTNAEIRFKRIQK